MSKPFIFEDYIPINRQILFDGKISINIPVDEKDKAQLNFTEKAWYKMMSLVAKFHSEVAWRGIVEHTDKNIFTVKDIIIYPQKVSGAYVEGDEQFLFNNYSREERNVMRLHGHSHNDMAPSPSSVDMSHRRETLEAIGRPFGDEDLYVIFMIMNRSLSIEATIYDVTNNKLYKREPAFFTENNGDISLNILYEDNEMEKFIADADSMVTEFKPPEKSSKKSSTPVGKVQSQYYDNYGIYGGYYGFD